MNEITYHIDDTFVSLKKITIIGWAVCADGTAIEFQLKRKSSIKKLDRPDVNNCFDNVPSETKSGFEITVNGFRKESIKMISSGNNFSFFEVNPFELKVKYVKATWNKIRSKIKQVGLLTTFKLGIKKLFNKNNKTEELEYMQWRAKHVASESQLHKQKKEHFVYEPLISIVVPTYNTPVNFLKEMIESVIHQTYANWELCIADGASADKKTINTLKEYEKNYSRIKVVYLNENKMISKNTNEALKLVSGDYVGLFDHDDLLEPDALYEIVKLLNLDNSLDMIYTDEDKTNYKSNLFFEPHFKPDFSKYTLLSYNYITHFTVVRKTILDEVGEFDSQCDGAQDFDMFLRISDITNNIGHIPKVLYHWRVHDQSTAASASAKSYVTDAGKYALEKYLKRNGLKGKVRDGLFPTSYKIDYEIQEKPLISIIVPNKDHVDDLDKCIQSILRKTTYDNYEIIIVENNSELDSTFAYYETLENDNVKVITWTGEFNYSAINNFAAEHAKGQFLLLLNNDVEIINEDWLNEMLMLAQLEDVGAVGAKLYYSDNTIQHAGIIIGIGSVAGHSHKYYPRESFGYVGRLKVTQNVSAVTAACLLLKKEIFEEVNGLDTGYKVAFNDVDFCLRILDKGYKNIFTPYAELYHFESKSRGLEDSEEKIARFNCEISIFEEKWGLWKEDCYYNKNLSITREDFSLRNE